MAELRFDFISVDKGLKSSLDSYNKDIDKLRQAFSSIGKGIDTTALKTQIDAQKIALIDARVEVQNTIKAGKELDNQNKTTRNSIASITEETKRYTLEQRKLRDANKGNYDNSEYGKLSKELNSLRGEAKNVGAELFRLSQSGDVTSKKFLELDARFKQLQSRINPLDNGIKKIDSSLGQFQRNVGNYSKGQANANGVAIEFTRIIQDAPFGVMGIGNNIQQLTANFGQYTDQLRRVALEQGKAISSMQIFRGVASSFLTTGNLVSLAVAGITSAWTYYTMWQQKANKASKETAKANKEMKDSLDAYVESMSSLTGALLRGEQNAEKELIRLKVLNSAYKNSNVSLKQRKSAYNEMVSMYETYFGKLTDEQKKVFDLGKHYDTLTNAIIKTAQARALEDELVNNAKKLRALEKQRNTEVSIYSKLQQSQNDEQLFYKDALLGKLGEENQAVAKILILSQLTGSGQEKNLKKQGQINTALDKWVKTSGRITDINKDNEDIYRQINEIISQGAIVSTNFGDSAKETNKSTKETFDYLAKIRDLIDGKQKDIDLINLDGQAKDLKELEYKWKDYFNQINSLQKRLNKDKSITDKTVIQNALNNAVGVGDTLQLLEQGEILKKYSDERQDIIKEMNDKVGLLEDNSREKDLKSFQNYLDDKIKILVSKGAIISDIQADLDKISFAGQYNINIKWDSKELEEWGKINDQIQDTIDKPFTGRNRDGIQRQIEARIITMRKLLESISRAMNLPFDEKEFERLSGEIKLKGDLAIDLNKAKIDIKDYVNIANQGLNTLFDSLNKNVEEFGFGLSSVLFSIGDTFKSVVENLNTKNANNFMESLTKANEQGVIDIKANWTEIKNDTVKMSQAIGVAMSSVGNLISSSTSKSSTVGQGLGGALSGAGAGISAGVALGGKSGGIWGAAIGGAIGLIGGIFGSKRARKQERLQQQQLAEQKKANALLERMNALTYASSVIGGRTQYGIVSGVNRNEFGEVTFRIQGKDLVASLDRTQQKTNR